MMREDDGDDDEREGDNDDERGDDEREGDDDDERERG